ncbi:glycosyltransferase [Limosilactobacillus reuteri]
MIKILHSEFQSNIGGIETFILNLSRYKDDNMKFDVLMRGNNPLYEKKLKNLGVTIYKVPEHIVDYILFIKRLLKNNYDFVHLHKNSAANIILPWLVKKYSNSNLIIHSHNTLPSSGSGALKILHYINRNYLYRMADYHFSCSDLATKWMYGNKKQDIYMMKNGIIVNDFKFNREIRQRIRRKLKLNAEFVIANVGAFRKQKNQKFLLDVIGKLDNNFKLLFIGNGPLFKELKDETIKRNLTDKVVFLGNRDDVNVLLQAVDLIAMPSLWEGLPISAIEAQTSGLPVLLSDRITRLVKITKNVKFLSLENVELWTNNIKNSEDRFLREDQSKVIESKGYSMEKNARNLMKFYATHKKDEVNG